MSWNSFFWTCVVVVVIAGWLFALQPARSVPGATITPTGYEPLWRTNTVESVVTNTVTTVVHVYPLAPDPKHHTMSDLIDDPHNWGTPDHPDTNYPNEGDPHL